MSTKKRPIYLDYNASAPMRIEAWEAIKPFFSDHHAAHNASSVHSYGREGRKQIEHARSKIASLIGTDSNQVIFNSGATEGNNTVLRHFQETYPNDKILISAAEHPSISQSDAYCAHIEVIPVDENGLLDLSALEHALQTEQKTSLVSCQFVNNESGVIQDVAAISALAHRYGALFHCDGTQAAGRFPLNIQECGIDFLTISSHKIGGPQGVGALALALCGQTPTLLFGGGQEKSARAGTENLTGIIGFGAAAQAAQEQLDMYQKLSEKRDYLEDSLKEISPDIVIFGKDVPRVSNTSFFSLPDTNAQTLLMAFDIEGIALSNGSACSSGTVKPSVTLAAMNIPEHIAQGALRVSIGWATHDEDIDALSAAWAKIITRMKPKGAS